MKEKYFQQEVKNASLAKEQLGLLYLLNFNLDLDFFFNLLLNLEIIVVNMR